MTRIEAIKAYIEKFDKGPPVWGLSEEEVIQRIETALETGREMKNELHDDLEDGKLL